MEGELYSFGFSALYGVIQLKNTAVLMFVVKSRKAGEIDGNFIWEVEEVREVKLREVEEPYLKPLLQSFRLLNLYYSHSYDLSRRLQSQYEHFKPIEHQYIANYNHTLAFHSFPPALLTVFISGFARTASVGGVMMSVISRGNVNRLGRRWLRRGIDRSGNTANEYETETVV